MRRTSRALPALALGLGLAIGLAGCGGSDDEPADDPTSAASDISKDDFVQQANDICTAGGEAIQAAGEALDPAAPGAIEEFATETLVPSVRGQLEDIRALGFPEGDEDLLDGVLSDADAALDEIEANPMVVAGGVDPFADVNQELTGYGLTECGSA